jgi:hypothetical protein
MDYCSFCWAEGVDIRSIKGRLGYHVGISFKIASEETKCFLRIQLFCGSFRSARQFNVELLPSNSIDLGKGKKKMRHQLQPTRE